MCQKINFDEFFRENQERHRRMIGKIIRNDGSTVEDIVQEAYLKAIRYQDRFNPDKSGLNTWFNTILFNTLKDYQKQHKNNLEDALEVDRIIKDEELTRPDPDFLEKIISANVTNTKHKRVLLLHYVCGYNSREISERVGELSVTNVTTICNRFGEKMRTKYNLEI